MKADIIDEGTHYPDEDVRYYDCGDEDKLYRVVGSSNSVWIMRPNSYDGQYCWHWIGDLHEMYDYIQTLPCVSKEDMERIIIKLDMMNQLIK
jgi:hypothetical protein